MKVVITSAGGMTGTAVVRACRAHGVEVRAVVSSSRRERQLREAGAEVVIGDLRDRTFVREAIRHMDAIYAIWPNFDPDEVAAMCALIDAFDGDRRFVLHSVLRPHVEAMPHHWAKMRVEEHLYTANMDFRILQPSIYADNIQRWLPEAREFGTVTIPWGLAPRMSFVDLRDVAEAAVCLITEDRGRGGTFEACGPRALNGSDVASCVQDLLGSDVAAIDGHPPATQSVETYAQTCWRMMVEYYAAHGFSGSSIALEALLGRAPLDLAEWQPHD